MIKGITLTIPIEAIQRAFAGVFGRGGTLTLKMGAKYALAGAWWRISGITAKGVNLEPVDPTLKITEAK
jgi:hypothetical protein